MKQAGRIKEYVDKTGNCIHMVARKSKPLPNKKKNRIKACN